jgi:protein-disulfide isomerase
VLVGAAVAVIAVIAVVVIALSVSGGSSTEAADIPERGSLAGALPSAAAVHTMLRGLPQSGNTLGRADAPVTMAEYVDLQCPYCRQFELDVMPKLVSDYVRKGKLRVELRPIVIIGPDSTRGRNAAIAAGDQDKMFDFSQLTFLNQGTENTGWLDDSAITALAASIPGLDVKRLLDDRDSAATSESADAFDQQASVDGVRSTPTVLVGKTGGHLQAVELSSPTDAASVVRAIENALS